MRRIYLTLFLLLTGLPAWTQSLGEIARKNREAKEGKKEPARVLTNDDISPNQAGKMPPYLPGTIACGSDMKCFLAAIDKGTLAWMTKAEKTPEASAIFTTSTTWWTTKYVGEACSVSIRLNEFSGEIDEERAKARRPSERPMVEAKLAELKREMPKVVGKDNTCQLTRSDLKKALTAPGLSLTTAAVLSFYDKGCTGPLFPDKR